MVKPTKDIDGHGVKHVIPGKPGPGNASYITCNCQRVFRGRTAFEEHLTLMRAVERLRAVLSAEVMEVVEHETRDDRTTDDKESA